MWKPDQRKHVILYQPISYGKKPNHQDPTCSFVGGPRVENTKCSVCGERLQILAQLHLSTDPDNVRTLQVLACHKGSCWRSLFRQNRNDLLCYGGGGVVQCRRIALERQVEAKPAVPDSLSSWAAPGNENWAATTDLADRNVQVETEWGMGDLSTDDLEAKLAAMETIDVKIDTKPAAVAIATSGAPEQIHAFPSFLLHSSREPPAKRKTVDEDDVGMSSADDKKIQAMLARYMEEEEDETILQALRSSEERQGPTGGNFVENDERLSATERALLTYTDRIKRSPRQVVRVARGAHPLWSIPTRQNAPSANSKQRYGMERPIPKCEACGTERMFEFQLVPSLLHALSVDRDSDDSMNWGNIAIYSCSCSGYCVVQDAVDEGPRGPRRQITEKAVLIPEGTAFDDDGDDDDDDGNEDEEMVDEEAW